MIVRFVLLVSMIPATALRVNAGDPITLEQALQSAMRNNNELRLAQLEVDASRADYNKSMSLFLPRLTLSEMVVKTNDPLNTFGFKLKQEGVTAADFNPSVLNDPNAITNFTTKADVQLPLFNPDGFFGRKAAGEALEANSWKAVRAEEFVKLEVKTAYFALVLASRSVEVLDQSIETAKSGLTQARQYHGQGMIHRSDVLQAEVRLLDLEAKRHEASGMVETLTERLRYLTGLTGDITPADSLTLPILSDTQPPFHEVAAQRADFRAMRSGLTAAQHMRSLHRASFLPAVNAFGAYEWNDRNFAGTGGTSWMVGIVAKWEIFNGWDRIGELQKANANTRRAEVALNQSLLQGRMEIDATRRELSVLQKKAELARQSVDQALENLRIVADRYDKGLERTTDFLQAQSLAENARLHYLQVLYAYRMAAFKLEFVTSRS